MKLELQEHTYFMFILVMYKNIMIYGYENTS